MLTDKYDMKLIAITNIIVLGLLRVGEVVNHNSKMHNYQRVKALTYFD